MELNLPFLKKQFIQAAELAKSPAPIGLCIMAKTNLDLHCKENWVLKV